MTGPIPPSHPDYPDNDLTDEDDGIEIDIETANELIRLGVIRPDEDEDYPTAKEIMEREG